MLVYSVKFSKNININGYDFIEQLKNLYFDNKVSSRDGAQFFTFHDALNFYQLLDVAIPAFLARDDVSEEGLKKCFEDVGFEHLLTALKKVKFFPDTNTLKINQNYFYEYWAFREFASSIRSQKAIKVWNGSILLFDDKTESWNFSEGNNAKEFLKAYIFERYQNRLKVSNSYKNRKRFSDEQDKEIEKLQLIFEQDTALLLTATGMLYVVAVKVRFKDLTEDPVKFKDFCRLKDRLLERLDDTESVVQVRYKLFHCTDRILEYYVIFLVQSPTVLNEESFIREIKERLRRSVKIPERFRSMLEVDCQNLNEIFRQTTLTSFKEKHFILLNGLYESNEIVKKYFFDFLYQLERFGDLADRQILPKSSVGLLIDEFYVEVSSSKREFLAIRQILGIKPKKYQTLSSLDLSFRNRHIWKSDHLSPQAQRYIQQISMIYREQFAMWGVEYHFELAIQLEIFIMSLRESPYNAFYPSHDVARKRANQTVDFKQTITRQLLQFCEIFKKRIDLDSLVQKLKKYTLTRTLNLFLQVYQSQKGNYRVSGTLDLFLGRDIENKEFRDKLDRLLGEYKFREPLFYGADICTQQLRIRSRRAPKGELHDVDQKSAVELPPIKVSENDVIVRQFDDHRYKLLHMQRHSSRLEKVQTMLKIAMKSDVVMIRCLFSCKSSVALEHKEMSRIFSGMLQANKKSAPFSSITAYLGYWEGAVRTSDGNHIKAYAANVMFMFKAQVLVNFPDLFSEIGNAWQTACRQHERSSDLLESIVGNVNLLTLAHSIEGLNCERLFVETTDKKLVKDIIQHFSNFIVYQDLLDDEIYQQLPKWLIKKTSTIKKPKAVRSTNKKS